MSVAKLTDTILLTSQERLLSVPIALGAKAKFVFRTWQAGLFLTSSHIIWLPPGRLLFILRQAGEGTGA